MRIALLLCGQYRSLLDERVLKAQNSFISKFNTDVFVSTWSDPGISVWDMFIKNPNIYEGMEINSNVITKLDNLIKYEINNFEDYIYNVENPAIREKLINFFKRTQNNTLNDYASEDRFITGYPQLYTISTANNLKREYETSNNFKYDIVIKSRPDFLFFKDISRYLDESYVEKSLIFTLNPRDHYWPNRIWDAMYFSSSENIDKLSETYNEYSLLSKQSITEKIKIKYGNRLGRKIDNSEKLGFISIENKRRFTNLLRAVEQTNACRLLFEKSKNEKIKIREVLDEIGEIVRLDNIEKLMSK